MGVGFMPDSAGQMYIKFVHGALREGKRAGRLALLQSDAILEVFRRHKSELRAQLLAGSAPQRAHILRGAFLVRLFRLPCVLSLSLMPWNTSWESELAVYLHHSNDNKMIKEFHTFEMINEIYKEGYI